ncbi:MAG: metallophosphoesterase [Planctomycetaceae bacterium]|nr:metallophosphoesterase [Planctomycetaceae bacterium]
MRNALIASLLFVLTASAAMGDDPQINLPLTKAAWTYSADEGKTFTLARQELRPLAVAAVAARAEFQIDDPVAYGGMFLAADPNLGAAPSYTINGKAVAGPLDGMMYQSIPLDCAKYLVKGKNVLVASGKYTNKLDAAAAVVVAPRLEILPPAAVAIQSGPVLGHVGADYFTVTCRTNIPAEVTAEAGVGKERCKATSSRGYIHRLKVPLPPGIIKFQYTVTARVGAASATAGPFEVTVPGRNPEGFRFVIAGDSRSNPGGWKNVAAASLKSAPEVFFFTGDTVSSGPLDELWDSEFFAPAKELFATVPLYSVIGNHEDHAPIYAEMIYSPGGDGRSMNWSQTIGGALFIGIDGAEDWKAGSKNIQWLQGVLDASKEKFVFFLTHYPAWSSGPHGRGEQPAFECRDVIMPLLAKYKVQAMVAGHDHDYERSEPPADKGVMCIVAGGAGAPLYKKSGRAAAGNPYSKLFIAGSLHYCVFDLTGETCTMKVYDLQGKLLDEKTFVARKL